MKPDWFSRILLLAILSVLILQWGNGRYYLTRDANVFDTRTGTLYSSEDGLAAKLIEPKWWDKPLVLPVVVIALMGLGLLVVIRKNST